MTVVTPTEHRVKLAVPIGHKTDVAKQRYVVECRCGWSSPICWSKHRANELYALHKQEGAPSAEPFDDGERRD